VQHLRVLISVGRIQCGSLCWLRGSSISTGVHLATWARGGGGASWTTARLPSQQCYSSRARAARTRTAYAAARAFTPHRLAHLITYIRTTRWYFKILRNEEHRGTPIRCF
jgi:hypothetical protein